jgi:L-fuconolactonase
VSPLDTHVHVWDPRLLDYPWIEGRAELDHAFRPSAFLSEQPTRSVFIEGAAAPAQSLIETRWVDGLHWPDLSGIVAGVDLRSDELPRRLDALMETGRVVGVRHVLKGEDATTWHEDTALLRGLRSVAGAGLTFDACVRSDQLVPLADLLAQAPALPVVLDHLGGPPVDDDPGAAGGTAWQVALRRVADTSTAHVKLSGLPARSNNPARYAVHADDYLSIAMEAFGVERCMVGSDWPCSAVLGAAESPVQWVQRVRRVAGSEDDWIRIADTTGSRFYGLADE